MRKRDFLAKGIIVALVAVMLVGCGRNKIDGDEAKKDITAEVIADETTGGNDADKEAALPTKASEPDEEPVVNVTEEPADTYEEQYADIMNAIRGFIKNGGAEETNPGFYGLEEAVFYGNRENIGYAYKDINGDGIPELFIGCFEDKGDHKGPGKEINAVWVLSNGVVTPILEGWSRSRVYLLDDNSLYTEGSGGASSSCLGVMSYQPDDDKYTVEDFYFTEDRDGELVVYRNKTGSWESSESEETDLSSDDFWDLMSEYESKTVDIEFNQLIEEVKPEVTASYAEDVDYSIADAKTYVISDSEYSVSVALLAENEITDFRIVELKYDENNENGIGFIANNLYYCDKMDNKQPMVVWLTFPGDMPNYGIIYVGQDGQEHSYALSQSGFDGSVILSEVNTSY